MAAAIFHLRDHLGEHERRVGQRAAKRARMEVGAAAAEIDLKVNEAAQAVADRRYAAREHPRIRDDDDVRGEIGSMAANEVVEVDAADLLFSLENELHVHRQPAVLLQVRFDCLQMHEDLAFVVGRAASVDFAVAHGPLKRRRLPKVERIHRLHIVMAVEENGRCARCAEPVAVHNRIAWRIDQPDILKAHPPHLVGTPFGAPLHIRRVLGQRADAWNREEGLQLREIAIAVDVDEIDDVIHVELFSSDLSQHGSSDAPCAVVVDRTPLVLQLFEVGAHVLLRRWKERRIQIMIDGFGNRLHALVSRLQRVEDLLLAHAAMIEIRRQHRDRIVDWSAVGGQQAPRRQRAEPLERRKVFAEIAAAAPMNHHAAAAEDEIAGKNGPRLLCQNAR